MALIVPSTAESQLATGLNERVAQQGGLLLRQVTDRQLAAHHLLQWCGLELQTNGLEDLTVDDFFALGYAYWQIQLMTRQLRYSSHLDEVHFSSLAVAAADAFCRCDATATRSALQQAFDLLIQERSRYFPVEAIFLDLVLTAETTLGNSLNLELMHSHPVNLMLTGKLLTQLRVSNSAAFESLRDKVSAESVELAGGFWDELPWSCMSIESMLNQFRQGEAAYRSLLDKVPRVFGRRTFGPTAIAPQILAGLEYQLALHVSFDSGRLPTSVSSPVDWEAPDGTSIFALMSKPLDAEQPDAFLKLGISIGEALDSAHSSATLLTHWPHRTCEWFGDLLRMRKFGSVLGEFVSLADFRNRASFSGHRVSFEQDEYRSEYLKQWQIQRRADPLSRWVDYWRAIQSARQVSALQLMAFILGGKVAVATQAATSDRLLETEVDVDVDSRTARPNEIESHVNGTFESELNRLEQVLSSAIQDQNAPETGTRLVIVNPLSQARRVYCEIPPGFGFVAESKTIFASDTSPERLGHVLVDVPPVGFAVVGPSKTAPHGRRRQNVSVVHGRQLQNEFFELLVDDRTGGIRSLSLFQRRGNLLSQHLNLRLAVPRKVQPGEPDSLYAQAVADQINTVLDSSVVGSIQSRGRLMVGDEVAARFVQTVTVWRGKRIAAIDVELEPVRELAIDPWRQYYCTRFAWPNEGAKLSAAINETRQTVSQSHFESCNYVEVDDGQSRVTVFPCGLPFHRKYEFRKLDTLLIVSGETRRRFRLGVGLNVDYPLRAAADFENLPMVFRAERPLRLTQESAWLLRIDCKNLLVTAWEPLNDHDEFRTGIRLRLKETEGRGGQARIHCVYSLSSASRVNLAGNEVSQLKVDGGAILVGFVGHEYLQVHLYWQAPQHETL